jgi:putative FmdB family regulatory protein
MDADASARAAPGGQRNDTRVDRLQSCFFGYFSPLAARTSTMPIYEYRCSACGFEKDALQKLSDPPLRDCPHCGKPALVKLVSAAGFQLKGSGWYATDFKGSGAKPKSDKPEAATGSESAATTGDSKAADKGSTTPATDTTKSGTPPAPGG